MELMVVTLIIGFLFSLLFIAPRFSKSDQTEKVHSDANTKTVRAYNKAEVLLHNKRTDCWIIIKEKKNTLVAMQFWCMLAMTQPKDFLGHSMQPEYLT
ncbi:cytochrome B5-like protein isoform X2 [Cynara cardunculus var. scolymus]|uniref:cytochrome B5-like protein isoform X2 n=1 Tax=Cynara cardunculus var. scolymus TaxID=59895 RepID=UPI000D62FAB1|nr:cytochrome B5-like protein isoform X2 [Cynara cardunculus var. scolymus]